MSGQSPRSPSLTEQLARRLARPVGPPDRARAALHVLDWAGCAAAGASEPAGRAMARGAAGAPPGPCALAFGGRTDAATAAFVNGALGNVLEMDDVDKRAILHPGPVVVPAALAAAEAAGASATAFLDALVRGYEAVIRLGRAVGPDHYRYWHNTGTCGPFGAAAAAASLMGLDDEAGADALGLAGTQASGLWQTRHEPASMAKQAHTARAAHAGLTAAMLARAGMGGPRHILEGPQGLFAATCGAADPAGVLAFGADAPWAAHEVSFKPWPACRHAHPAIDAALALRAEGLRPDQVEVVAIEVYADAATFCDRPEPRTTNEAKFSLQHAVAVALLDGPPALAAFAPERLADPATAALRAKARVAVVEPYASAYPARYGSGVTVRLASGESLAAAAPDALGDPENPLSPEAIATKARTLMAHAGVPDAAAARVVDAALGLAEPGGDVGRFAAALCAMAPAEAAA